MSRPRACVTSVGAGSAHASDTNASAASRTEVIDIAQLTARYAGQPPNAGALRNLSFVAEPGERVLLLGANGAGKSTLLRILAGLMKPGEGEALICGLPAASARHLVGIVAHRTYLYDELTALENLRLYAELYSVREPERRAAELLETVHLASRAKERVGRLSRGQQQRVALARALVHDPALLLLDEPDTGLDLAAFQVLEAIVRKAGRTVLLTTHHVAAMWPLGTRALVLDRGRLVRDLSPLTADALADVERTLALSVAT